jgi:CDP-glucose 4,6-dehydratase
MVINKKFWNEKTVLLTGHTGFKGSWLTIWLKKLGANVIGFSKDVPTVPSLFELANVKNGIDSIIGDITNYNEIRDIIRKTEPEIVFHMAAQSLVHFSYTNPRETYETNVMGTVNLMDALREQENVRVIINVTSDKCYENKESKIGHVEDDQLGGYDPYSNSKGCSELVTSAFRNSFFNISEYKKHKVALASVRAGNVIGGGDWGENRLVPDLMNALINNTKIKIRNPQAIRPWQHVLEPLQGYLLLAEKMWLQGEKFSEAWNFGPNEESKSVSWIIDKIMQLYGKKCQVEINTIENPHETEILKLNCMKAHKKLGWIPKTNTEQGLQLTVDWYKQYEKQENIRKITEKQIDSFSSM